MATNTKHGYRIGAIKGRSQVYDPQNDEYIKREKETGHFVDQKHDHKPFKGVRQEKRK